MTVYRNIQPIENATLYHLHTVAIGETIHVAQYDSEMLVSVIDPDTDAVIATKTVSLVSSVEHSSLSLLSERALPIAWTTSSW